MFTINLFSIENIFNFSLSRKSSLIKERMESGIDQAFFSISFKKSVFENLPLIQEIKKQEDHILSHYLERFDNISKLLVDYHLHLNSFIIASHLKFITNGMMEPSSYLIVLNILRANLESKDSRFLMIPCNIPTGFKGDNCYKDASTYLKTLYINKNKYYHNYLIMSQSSNRRFERHFKVKIEAVRCEKNIIIGVILKSSDLMGYGSVM